MRALSQTLVVAALGISFLPSAFSGDALSDAAAREKERRKGKTGKVYTEEDLKQKEPGRQQEQQQQGLNGNNPGGSGLTVTFNFPLDGSTVYGKVPLNVSVSPAENLDGALFYANDQLLGKAIDTAEWINKAWITDSLPAGRYTIRAEAKDKKGRTGSAKVTVTLSKTVHVDPIMSSCKPSSAVPAKGVFGINNAFGDDQRAMTEIKDLGMKWVRRDLSWYNIELVQGTYDWVYADMVMISAHDSDLQVLATANHAPPWVENVDWPTRYAAYQAFMQAAAARYKPGGTLAQKQGWKNDYGVSYWELWNEPNDPGAGWLWPPNPEQYAMMLAHGAAGVRASDPAAFVLFGGLSNIGISPSGFVEYAYILGAKNCFDIVATHPYGYLDRFNDLVGKMRTLLAAYGDQNKPIWFTEYGTLSNQNRDTEVTKVWAQKDAAQGFFWFGLRDSTSESWGFLTNSWEKKDPAYKTMKNLLTK